MKRLLACSSVLGFAALGLLVLSPIVACTDNPADTGGDASTGDASATDTGSPSTGDASDSNDASDSGDTNPLGFKPSNTDTATGLADALNAPDLGDLNLSDCGPELISSEIGKVGCNDPDYQSVSSGGSYKRIEGFGGTKKYEIFVARNITVEAGRILAAGGDRPAILIARDTITINGGIDVSPGKVGAYVAPDVGPGDGKSANLDTTGEGGGGGFCGAGGKGGINAAAGGATYGNATIVPLQGGSNGGALLGAAGGGALQLVAGQKIVIAAAGFIDAPGDGTGGGGGSGGAILLEAPTVQVLGSITANGGSGGAPGGNPGTKGGRTATPTPGGMSSDHINGGAGGAGASVNGGDGVKLGTDTEADGHGSANGGGGAGWIRINTASGAAEISGVISPSIGGACASQGTLNR